MKYVVSEVEQNRSGGSYVVKYEAEVELLPIGDVVSVEVLSTIPPDPDSEMVEQAKEFIRRGAESVLDARGAVLRLSRLVIHPVDFHARLFERFTSEGLRTALASDDKSGKIADLK